MVLERMLCLTRLDELQLIKNLQERLLHLQSRQPSTALKSFLAHSGTYWLLIVRLSSSGLSEISTLSSVSKSSKRFLSESVAYGGVITSDAGGSQSSPCSK